MYKKTQHTAHSVSNLFSLSSLVSKRTDSKFDIESPEKGTWYETNDKYWLVGASHGSYYSLFIVPFTCMWAGSSLSGIYGTQIKNMNFGWGLSSKKSYYLINSLKSKLVT